MRIEMLTRGIWNEGRNVVDQEAIDDAIIGRRHERPGIRRRSSAPGRLLDLCSWQSCIDFQNDGRIPTQVS